MATSRTFEILWEKLENERTAFDSLFKNDIATSEESLKRLTIIKRNLDDILRRAQKGLRDPWELEEITMAAKELMNTVSEILGSMSKHSSR